MRKKPTPECFDTRIATATLGKCAYNGRRRENAVEVRVGWEYLRGNQQWGAYLSVQGSIWNRTHTDSFCCGQCLDELRKFAKELTPIGRGLFKRVFAVWELYHGNWRKDLTAEQVEHVNRLIDDLVAAGGKLKELKGGE